MRGKLFAGGGKNSKSILWLMGWVMAGAGCLCQVVLSRVEYGHVLTGLKREKPRSLFLV